MDNLSSIHSSGIPYIGNSVERDDNTFEKNSILEDLKEESDQTKKNTIFNEDGSLNPQNVGIFFEAGYIDANSFIEMCGYDLSDPNSDIYWNRSGDFEFELDDGTKISGNLGMNMLEYGVQHIYIESPDGNEYYYTYDPNK